MWHTCQSASKKYYYDIINHAGNTYKEVNELAMTLAEIFRNEGMEKGLKKGKLKEKLSRKRF